jgi:hypothetical protein
VACGVVSGDVDGGLLAHLEDAVSEFTYAILDDGTLLTLNYGELVMSESKPQGPVLGTIGGAWAAFEVVKKYGPFVAQLLPWLVVAFMFISGKSATPPGLPPVLPQGYYESDGVQPLKVKHDVVRFGRLGEEPVKESK